MKVCSKLVKFPNSQIYLCMKTLLNYDYNMKKI